MKVIEINPATITVELTAQEVATITGVLGRVQHGPGVDHVLYSAFSNIADQDQKLRSDVYQNTKFSDKF